MSRSNRVLIIGLDGATWDVLDPWLNDGTLPNLAKLRKHGSWGVLQSTIPPITAAAWSTFMTGKKPGKHSVFHFIKLFDEDNSTADNKPELVSARSVKSATMWDAMGHHDRQVVLINIPLTYPPRPVNGVMITGLLTPKHATTFTHPPELSTEITDYKIDLERFAGKKPYQDDFGTDITTPTLSLMEEFEEMLEKRAQVSFSLMDSKPWDTFMVVIAGTDRMGHYLWPYHRCEGTDDSPVNQQLCQAVRNYYIRLDEIVGELVARAGQDVTTLVMSDHGMGPPPNKYLHCNYWLQQQGWLSDQSAGNGDLMNADGWLKRLGIPRDKVGRVLRHIPGVMNSNLVKQAVNSRASAVDTNHSKAYCVPIFSPNIMGIRVNLEGEEKEALCQEIMQKLQEIVDPDTDQAIVQHIQRGSDYYYGLYADNVPDIIAIVDPDYSCNYHMSHYSSIVTKKVVASDIAGHRMEGIFIIDGPDIKTESKSLPNLNIEDVAPTVLYLLGLPVPSDMDGRVITEVIESSLLESQPVNQAEPKGYWPDESAAIFSDEEMSGEDEEQIRDRLQALGYFE